MCSCNSVNQEERRTKRNTHDTVLRQPAPILHDCRADPSAARNYHSRRKPTSKLFLDPHTILNDDKRIGVVKQGAQKIRSRCHVRKCPVKSSIFRKRTGKVVMPSLT